MIKINTKINVKSDLYHRGFTLTELLFVVGILVILATLTIGVSSRWSDINSRRSTKAMFDSIGIALEEFYDARGHYPYQVVDCQPRPNEAPYNMNTADEDAYPAGAVADNQVTMLALNQDRFDAAKRNSIFLLKQLRTVSTCNKILDGISSSNLIHEEGDYDVFESSSGQYDSENFDLSSATVSRFDLKASDGDTYEYLLDGFDNPVNYQLIRQRQTSGGYQWTGKGKPLLISAGIDKIMASFVGEEHEDQDQYNEALEQYAEDDIRSDAK